LSLVPSPAPFNSTGLNESDDKVHSVQVTLDIFTQDVFFFKSTIILI